MNKPKPVTPQQVAELESSCPNITRFLRKAVDYGSPESKEMLNAISEQARIETALAEAMDGRVPIGIFNMFLKEMDTKEFREGILECFKEPNRSENIRTYVTKWFFSKGVVFKYGEKEVEKRTS